MAKRLVLLNVVLLAVFVSAAGMETTPEAAAPSAKQLVFDIVEVEKPPRPLVTPNPVYPVSAQAECSGFSRDSFPTWSVITLNFPARVELPPLRWTWYDGSSQEEGDDYYFGVTIRAQKMVADFGPDVIDRLLGRSMGETKSRLFSQARARAQRSRAMVPRGLAP